MYKQCELNEKGHTNNSFDSKKSEKSKNIRKR